MARSATGAVMREMFPHSRDTDEETILTAWLDVAVLIDNVASCAVCSRSPRYWTVTVTNLGQDSASTSLGAAEDGDSAAPTAIHVFK